MALDKFLDFFSDREQRPNKFTRYMGDAVRRAREEAGISQKNLAEKIFRRQATLSDIENGKVEVETSTLSLLSYYLKKPLGYFYPKPLYEDLVKKDMDELSLQMQMQFEQIYGDDLKNLAIDIIKVMGKFDPKDMVIDLAPDILNEIEGEEELRKAFEKRRKKK